MGGTVMSIGAGSSKERSTPLSADVAAALHKTLAAGWDADRIDIEVSEALHRIFDSVLDEPLPDKLKDVLVRLRETL